MGRCKRVQWGRNRNKNKQEVAGPDKDQGPPTNTTQLLSRFFVCFLEINKSAKYRSIYFHLRMQTDFNLSDLYLLKNTCLKKFAFCKMYREPTGLQDTKSREVEGDFDNCLVVVVVVVVDAYIILCFYFSVHFKWQVGPLHQPVAFRMYS